MRRASELSSPNPHSIFGDDGDDSEGSDGDGDGANDLGGGGDDDDDDDDWAHLEVTMDDVVEEHPPRAKLQPS